MSAHNREAEYWLEYINLLRFVYEWFFLMFKDIHRS